MTPQSEEMLIGRIQKVEKQNKWLFFLLIMCVVLAAPLMLKARRQVSKTVEAEKFILRDGSGKMLGELRVDSAHYARLIFYGPDAKEVLGLRGGVNGAILSLENQDSKVQISNNGAVPSL